MKKLFVSAAAAAMVLGLGTTGVYAAGEDTKEVPVSYDNSETITDPDDSDANWGVKVPSAIQFTDTSKTDIDASIELVGLNGTVIGTIDKTVEVSIQSKNGMKLYLGVNDDPVEYTLTYDGTTSITGTGAGKVTLNSKNKTESEGKATMTGTATKKGAHTDTLTYTVAKKTV